MSTSDDVQLARLKKRKLRLKDEIKILEDHGRPQHHRLSAIRDASPPKSGRTGFTFFSVLCAPERCGISGRWGNSTTEGQLTPKLVDGLYVEAMVLADEARSYFDTGGRDDRLALDPLDRVGFSCESLKVTTRLMHVIAWLLTQRAVAAGELSRAQAGMAERRLGAAADTDRSPARAAARSRGRADSRQRGTVRPGQPPRSGQLRRGCGQSGAQPAEPAAALVLTPRRIPAIAGMTGSVTNHRHAGV